MNSLVISVAVPNNLANVLQFLYSDSIEEKQELIKGITLGDKDKFQLTPLRQVNRPTVSAQDTQAQQHKTAHILP